VQGLLQSVQHEAGMSRAGDTLNLPGFPGGRFV